MRTADRATDESRIEQARSDSPDITILKAIERRVLWLAVRMIDAANRPVTEVKVGGHQASSASMVSIMTALWFGHLSQTDKVAIKPHAAPIYHAIKYLCGDLDRSYLTRLRRLGGLQAYPSRTKDPDVADFSTGSVGLGAVAPLFSAAVRRYADAHFGERPKSRFIAICGDAELDEGNVWEAVLDPALEGLANVMLIIDLNRQSLDRVVPAVRARRLANVFENAGWHVHMAKYGSRLRAMFDLPDGDRLRRHIDTMTNEEYQSLFGISGATLRERFLANADAAVEHLLDDVQDEELGQVIHNLEGHDIASLIEAYQQCDLVTDRPSVVFAYTIKGWGLPMAGDPLNHAAMLTREQIDALRTSLHLTEETEWDPFPGDSPEGELCEAVGARLRNRAVPPPLPIAIPDESGAAHTAGRASTQEAFGRILVALGRQEHIGRHMATVSPDVAISTNLGGWINAHGVFAPTSLPDYGPDRLLRWHRHPGGRHIELGIAEMNLFMMLGQLGLAHDHHGEVILPIGTVYDPFVLRGLDAFIYSAYSGSRFIVVGTPSGVTLAPEGGAHQSTVTTSLGMEMPGITMSEPAFVQALDWLLCDALADLIRPDGTGHYLRLSTRPIEQHPFSDAIQRVGAELLRSQVLAGAYVLWPARTEGERLVLMASGAVMPEVLAAADLLEDEGVAVTVVDVTSQDRLYRGWQGRLAAAARSASLPSPGHLSRLLDAEERRAPIVTVHDAASHSMAWVGSVHGQRVVPVGVDRFGESGTIDEVYSAVGLDPGTIANAALIALAESL